MSEVLSRWKAGYGPISHSPETQDAIALMVHDLVEKGQQPSETAVYEKLIALDRIAAAAKWLVVHMTYANRVRLDGSDYEADDFKLQPEGHTGGALNMVPAYAAYMTLNALTGETRGWLMGQGHCVAAIEAINVLLGNMHPEQANVYGTDEAGLNRLLNDFYGYKQAADGSVAAPLGSHVNPHTAGGIIEGGYLGFAELQYAHMPLPGEKLVTFLSDGAAEEQRGSDWIPRWWRAEDSGMALPIMIANGRRIEQRTQMGSLPGLHHFIEHLKGCGFDPITFDGRDPALFVHTLWEMERRLQLRVESLKAGERHYPLAIPYGIAYTTKGYGFYGANENAAHNLPLPANPRTDERARHLFNVHAKPLWVDPDELKKAISLLKNHSSQQRVLERDNTLANRAPRWPTLPSLGFLPVKQSISAMAAVDQYFTELVGLNASLRPRVGNPDELASNRLTKILKQLKHRVAEPESEFESVHGNIITALNEEAVVSACLGNQGGLNLVASYEAFCVKMLGALRQRIIFARQQKEIDRPAQWLSWPVIATSHTWENGKNQQSHQDTTFAESLMGEMNDVARVVFPADYNSMLALLPTIYGSRGQIACVVAAKRDRPVIFTAEQAQLLAQHGVIVLKEKAGKQSVLLAAVGSYQLEQVLLAAQRLEQNGYGYRIIYIQEPARLRQPRDEQEKVIVLNDEYQNEVFSPAYLTRIAVVHIRPEVFRGHLGELFSIPSKHRVLGYINRGGTLDEFGMLFTNRSTWAHVLYEYAELNQLPLASFLSEDEIAAVHAVGQPSVLRA